MTERNEIHQPITYAPQSNAPSLGEFLRGLGTQRYVCETLSNMNIQCSSFIIRRWIKTNEMPKYIYDALKHLAIVEKPLTAEGDKTQCIDIFHKDKFIGRLELARGISAKVKRRMPYKEKKYGA